MAGDGGTKAVVTALVANCCIAVAKFIAAAITGSASMLAEGVHSVADSTNQALLLVGGRRAKREATTRHPFGYGRERYIYAFIVSIVLFSVGGLYALYEGVKKVRDPHELTDPAIAIGVLVLALGLESWALRTAVKEANHVRGRKTWVQFVRRAKAPELPVILLEDAGAVIGLILALVGVSLTMLTGNGVFDGIATLCIGALLAAIAVVLAIETKSLLIGEAAAPDDVRRIEAALLAEPSIDKVLNLRTMHIGPEELLIAAEVEVGGTDQVVEIAAAIENAEAAIRAAVPAAVYVYVEPDAMPLVNGGR